MTQVKSFEKVAGPRHEALEGARLRPSSRTPRTGTISTCVCVLHPIGLFYHFILDEIRFSRHSRALLGCQERMKSGLKKCFPRSSMEVE